MKSSGSPSLLALSPAASTGSPASSRSWSLDAALTAIGRVWCGLTTHNDLFHFEANRLSMRCASCGRTTVGIEVGK